MMMGLFDRSPREEEAESITERVAQEAATTHLLRHIQKGSWNPPKHFDESQLDKMIQSEARIWGVRLGNDLKDEIQRRMNEKLSNPVWCVSMLEQFRLSGDLDDLPPKRKR